MAFNFEIISEFEVHIIYPITTYNIPGLALFLSIPRARAILHLFHIRRHEYIPRTASLMLLLVSVQLPLGYDK